MQASISDFSLPGKRDIRLIFTYGVGRMVNDRYLLSAATHAGRYRLLPDAEHAVAPGADHTDFIFSPEKIAIFQPRQ